MGRAPRTGRAPRALRRGTADAAHAVQKKPRADAAYEFVDDDDDGGAGGERRRKDYLRRFGEVKVLEEEGQGGEDEEVDEDEAFAPEDYALFGDVGRNEVHGKRRGRRGEEEAEEEAAGDEDDDGEIDGLFKGLEGSDGEGGSGEGEEEEEEETDLARALGLAVGSAKPTKRREAVGHGLSVNEASTEGVGRAGGVLSIADLLTPVQKAELLRKSVKGIKGKGELAVPLSGDSQRRLVREEQFSVDEKQVSTWQAEVKKNREADHISFPLRAPARVNLTSKSLTGKFTPAESGMEGDIMELLRQAGEIGERKADFESLELNKLSAEEVEKRRAELSKMRSLMFFHEMKMRRLGRIKSRNWHRHNKKKGGDGAGSDGDEEAQAKEAEKAERERIRERMSLRHRNTSTWVKHQLHRGHVEQETRDAINEQIRRGEELRRKMAGESDAESRSLASDSDLDIPDEPEAPTKGVLGMAFMQRSMERKRAEADALMRELEATEMGSGSDGDGRPTKAPPIEGKRRIGQSSTKKASAVAQPPSAAAMKENDSSDSGAERWSDAEGPAARTAEAAPKVKRPAGKTAAVDVEIDEGSFRITRGSGSATRTSGVVSVAGVAPPPVAAAQPGEVHSTSIVKRGKGQVAVDLRKAEPVAAVAPPPQATDKVNRSQAAQRPQSDSSSDEGALDSDAATGLDESNPWLQASKVSSKKRRDSKGGDTISVKNAIVLEAPVKRDRTSGKTAKAQETEASDNESLDGEEAAKLVRESFAAPDLKEEFEAEKLRDVEGGAKIEKPVRMAGWGSWGGEGLAMKGPSAEELAAKQAAAVSTAASSRADAKLPHVILNEKRNKKSVKYLADIRPHQFANREVYEASLRAPLGPEWNTMTSHVQLNAPKVTVKAGQMIKPISVPKSLLRKRGAEHSGTAKGHAKKTKK